MRTSLVAVVVVGVLVVGWIGVRWRRRHQAHGDVIVSQQWRVEHAYDKDGDQA